MEFALINKNTNEVIKKDDYPRTDLNPVIGLDPALEWAVIVEDPYPGYDASKQYLTPVETVTTRYHEVYNHLRIIQRSWLIVEIPSEPKTLTIEEEIAQLKAVNMALIEVLYEKGLLS